MAKKHDTPESETSPRIESRYQPGLLRQCIADGMSADAILERLEIRNMATLRKHALRIMAESKTYFDIDGLFMRGGNMPKVNPKGRLTINLRGMIIGGEEVREGDLFQVRVEEDKIILTRG